MKMFEIKNRFNGSVIFKLGCKSFKLCIEAAIKDDANLSSADLRFADLRYADLSYANLSSADLRFADLSSADLSSADLSSANLDFSCWPLHCGSFGAKADDRIVAQLLHHVAKLDLENCSGGVKESIEHIRAMAISDLFCEYRSDIERIEK